jgi:hypothetical protein
MADAIYHRFRITGDKEAMREQYEKYLKGMGASPQEWNVIFEPIPDWIASWPVLSAIHERPLGQIQGLIAASRIARALGKAEDAEMLELKAAKGMAVSGLFPALLGAWTQYAGKDTCRPHADNVRHDHFTMYFSRKRGVHAGECNTWGRHYYQGLSGIGPETAAYWKDAPGSLLIDPVLQDLFGYAVDWYVTDGPPSFHLTEMSRMPPEFAWTMFKVRAFYFRDSSRQLAENVDIPFCRMGDMYHMQKLALAILAAADSGPIVDK